MMEAARPDLVVLDSVMPGVGGEQVVRHMRESESLADVPVVIVSGQDWIDPRLTVGDTVIMKSGRPISLSEGIECIRGVLSGLAKRAPLEPEDDLQAREAAPVAQASVELPGPRAR
jgi:CheY-like chemotaxis protein